MFLVGLLGWWYGAGWQQQLRLMGRRLSVIAAFFSIGQLAGTLFSPWRQISAGKVNGPAGAQLRGVFDNLLSRLIGAFVRLTLIITGGLLLVIQVVYEALRVLMWLLLPGLPVAGLVLMAIGWVPVWM